MKTETIEAFSAVVMFVPILVILGVAAVLGFIWWDNRAR